MDKVVVGLENFLAIFCTIFFFGIKAIDFIWGAIAGILQFMFLIGISACVLYGVEQLPQPFESVVFTFLLGATILCGVSMLVLMAWRPERFEEVLDTVHGYKHNSH